MIDNVNKVISFLFKGRPAQENQQIQEAKEVRQQDDYLSKDDYCKQAANRGLDKPNKNK
jgi:preprotein translocase subunit SecA